MLYHYGTRSVMTRPETHPHNQTDPCDVEQANRITRNVLKSKRPAGTYTIVKWPHGAPWEVTTVATFVKEQE